MSYVNRPADDVISEPAVATRAAVVDYHDRVRWGPIISGLVVALATQLLLSALFGAIGATTISGSGAPRTNAPDVAGNVGIWSTIGLLISLFVGGWVTARACGPMNRSTALLNGAILWATTLALGSWLLASGVTGAFGLATQAAANVAGGAIGQVPSPNVNVTPPNVTAQDTRNIASNLSQGLWWFFFGSLLGLIASMIGAAAGARSPRTNVTTTSTY
ncbi:hypothetical protein IQ230_18200 [Gloeocapsopsis crepidinum LEGE 06123]|uniref:PhnA-like protein n=1 Tax=Gloeocapsopsis crepidinum LEGE 06123 TaxID=588587 RepID=A0ABR9UVC5_9CHRO|nr:hypothetical protein [Gloeocapsopsis crepidinum]MBE9192252.1 hypothetical protein [Gloeocapsopsis crepidinum LEGE 06123]